MGWSDASANGGFAPINEMPGGGSATREPIEFRTQTIALASDTISLGSSTAAIVVVELVNGSGGAITLASTPNMQAGQFDGQIVVLRNRRTGSAVSIVDESGTVGAKNRLNAGTGKQLTPGDVLCLSWDATNSEWRQTTTLQAL